MMSKNPEVYDIWHSPFLDPDFAALDPIETLVERPFFEDDVVFPVHHFFGVGEQQLPIAFVEVIVRVERGR